MLKVLIVDDMKNFLNLEKSFLKRADSEVLTAMTGLEAVKVAREKQPDIILLDVEMPEMNGIEATRILKNLPETKNIPIVIITSLNVHDQAVTAGADDYHQKPVDEDVFLGLIQKFVQLPLRKERRVSIDLDVAFFVNKQKWPAAIKDISSTGCFVGSTYKPPVGELILLDFYLPLDGEKKQIRQDAYVVRVTDAGFGCSFHDVANGTELFLNEFLTATRGSGN